MNMPRHEYKVLHLLNPFNITTHTHIPENDLIHFTQQQNLEATKIHEYKDTHAHKWGNKNPQHMQCGPWSSSQVQEFH
jgi:hypothetical protein